MKPTLYLTAFLLLGTTAARAVTSPASVQTKVFEVRLSVNPDCSSSFTVIKNANPTPVDFISLPTLGSGVIPHGTYHCVAVHLSDVITVTPQANDGANCQAGVSFTQDIFNDPNQGHVSYTPGGAIINGTSSEDDPWIYFTDSNDAGATNSCFLPPFGNCACINTGPCPLTTLTVKGDRTHTIVMNFDNAVGDFGNGKCEIQLPKMTLR